MKNNATRILWWVLHGALFLLCAGVFLFLSGQIRQMVRYRVSTPTWASDFDPSVALIIVCALLATGVYWAGCLLIKKMRNKP